MNNNGSSSVEESVELVHIPALVRGFIVKFPQQTINALIEWGIFDNLGYRLTRVESNGHED